MKPENLQPMRRLIMPDPLAGVVLLGLMGRVYAAAEIDEQPVAPCRLTGPGTPIHEDSAVTVSTLQNSTINRGSMTTEQNKAIARRWTEELWSQGKLAVADEIIALDYVRHDAGDPFPARGPEDVKRIVSMLRTMLPDLRLELEDMIADEDKVVSRYTGTATDTAGYMGMPPSGKVIRTVAIQIFRFADGKIVESWAVRDDLGTLRQLGQFPPLGPKN
jgi:steroid delta-isomerase-like uncharacterized protein